MSLLFKGLILDEIDFWFYQRVPKNNNIDESTFNGEDDLECYLAWGKIRCEQKNGICYNKTHRNESQYDHPDLNELRNDERQ